MATNGNHENGESTKGQRKMSAQKRRAKQRARIMIFAVELLVIVVMLIVVLKVFQTTEETEGPHFAQIEESQIIINSEVVEKFEESEELKGYWNIALFGVDAVNDEQLYKNSRSDTIMVASINQDTGDIKLVSVYRDTYMNLGNDRYTKCNAAYSNGGAEQAMAMLNMNLDLNITDFVTVGYEAVIDCVDGLGGVYIEVDSEELKHINNYQKSILRDTDIDAELEMVEDTGYQELNGLQAAAYCRIRYTAGDDFKRAERQREVIQAMADKAKTAKLADLTKVFTKVVNNVYTSIDQQDMLDMLGQVANYSIVAEDGFPQRNKLVTENIGIHGNSVVPTDLETNVVWLHEFLFGVEDYEVSETVKECNDQIKADTSPYLNRATSE